jgi:hypothetical protein
MLSFHLPIQNQKYAVLDSSGEKSVMENDDGDQHEDILLLGNNQTGNKVEFNIADSTNRLNPLIAVLPPQLPPPKPR